MIIASPVFVKVGGHPWVLIEFDQQHMIIHEIIMAGFVRHRRTLTGGWGYNASQRLLASLQELLVGTQGPVDFHAGTSFTDVLPRLASHGGPAHSMTALRTTKTCSKRLRVLLAEDVEGLGKAGQLVQVASGYARNFLLPNRLARIHVEDERAGRKRYRGLALAAMKRAQDGGGLTRSADLSATVGASTAASVTPVTAAGTQTNATTSTTNEQVIIEQKREVKKLENIVRKLTENPVVFKGLKTVNGVLETSIGPSEIRVATAKQLGIEIVDELINMEGDVLDRPGDYLIPLKLEDIHSGARSKMQMNVRIEGAV